MDLAVPLAFPCVKIHSWIVLHLHHLPAFPVAVVVVSLLVPLAEVPAVVLLLVALLMLLPVLVVRLVLQQGVVLPLLLVHAVALLLQVVALKVLPEKIRRDDRLIAPEKTLSVVVPQCQWEWSPCH